MNEVTEITPHIFLSNYENANNENVLRTLKITNILSLLSRKDKMKHYPGIKYKRFTVEDDSQEGIERFFRRCRNFIDKALNNGGTILIHCMAGISRSPTILASYLMKKIGLTAKEAIEYLKDKRNCVSPNYGFMNQLQRYEKKCK